MASTSVVFDILARDRASSKFAQVANAADRSSSRMSKMGTALKGAAAVGFGALAYGAASFAKSSIDIEKQFSTTMRLTQAATKASAGEMDKLNDLAIKLGADTSFSANEAATAMLELAKAGLDTKTIMGGGLAGTLTLAAAGGTDLATASTIASNAMNTFNLAGRDMDKIAAALAGGANASSASVESLGQALRQVGPGATNAGLSLQETVAALSAFDAAGIKGSDAGTSLKTMLTRLVPATDKAQQAMEDYNLSFVNADGSFKSLTQISEQLRRGLSKLSDEQRTHALATIFGSDATRAATVLMHEGAKGIQQYIKATNDQAAAEKMAAARMGGTEGAMERLSGSIETAKLRLGQEFAPMVVKVADGLGENLVPAMEHVIDGGKEMADAVAPAFREIAEALGHLAGEGGAAGDFFEDAFIPALRATSEVVGKVVDVIDDLPGPVKSIGAQVAIAALVWPKFAGGVTAATGAVTLQIAKLQQLRAELTYTETRGAAVTSVMSKMSGALRGAAGIAGMVALAEASQETNDALKALDKTAGGAFTGFSVGGPVGAAIGGVAGLGAAFGDLQGAFRDLLGVEDEAEVQTQILADQQAAAAAATERHKDAVDALRAALDAGTTSAASLEPAYANVVAELEAGGISASTASRQWALLGISQRTVAQASLGNKAAIKAVNEAYANAPLKDRIINEHVLADAMDNSRLANREAIKAEREHMRLTQEWGGKLKDFPKESRSTIRLDGIEPTMKGIASVVSQFKGIDNKDIKTILSVTGVKGSVADVRELAGELEHGLPKKVASHISTPGVDLSFRQILKLQRRYDLLPKTVRSLFKQEGIPAGLRGIARIVAAHGRIDNKTVKTLIRVLGVDATVAQVRGAAKELDRTGGKTSKPKLKVDGVPGFLADFLHVNRTIDDTGRKTSKPGIAPSGMQAFFSDFARANAVISSTDGRRADTYIVTHHVDIHESRGGRADGGTIGYSTGGTVAGQRAPYGDKVSTMLAPGEEVTSNRRGQADRFRPALKAINADKPPAEVAKIVERLADGGTAGGGGMSRLRFDPQINARMTVNASKFKGVGAGVIHAFAQGINGTAHEAEKAVDRMLAAISKALKKKDITEAAAKQMREAVQAMAREAERGRAMLSKRADFAKSLRESFAGELGLGELVSSESFGGIGDITGGAQALAARLKAFAGQLRELREDGIPKGLIAEIAGLGSDQGSKAAAAILAGTQGQEAALSSAYNAFQQAAGLAANTAANVRYGTAGQIKNEFHVEIHVDAGGHGGQGGHGNHDAHRIGREAARGFHQELLKIKRETGQPLGLS